jgi:anaphase-promoting complex subunit 4
VLASATDLFAFQGSQTRSTPKSSLPDVIKGWPTLHSDPLAASMSPSLNRRTRVTVPGPMDEVDDLNVNSILAVTDDVGHIHSFLDGSYPLGIISLGSELSIPSLFKHPSLPTFFAHPQISVDNTTVTNLQPVTIVIPLLDQRQVRSFARLSSTARELVWYTIRVVKDMLAVWFGSDTLSGARELGPKWIRALETKQQDQFGREYWFPRSPTPPETNPVFRGRTKFNVGSHLSACHGACLRLSRGLFG